MFSIQITESYNSSYFVRLGPYQEFRLSALFKAHIDEPAFTGKELEEGSWRQGGGPAEDTTERALGPSQGFEGLFCGR